MEKLRTRAGPGKIIGLTRGEWKVAKEMVVVPIGPPAAIPSCPHGISMSEQCAMCGRFKETKPETKEQ